MIQPQKIVKDLNFERLAGSEGERKGAEIISKYLDEINVKYELDPFELNAFDTGSAIASIGQREFKLIPFGLTKSLEISGELVFLENADSLLYNKGCYQDKIIIGYTYSRNLSVIMKEEGVKAFIKIGPPYRKAMSLSYRQKQFEEGYVPSFTVDYDMGAKISKLEGLKLNIKVEQKVEKRTANNIVATIPGKGKDKNVIYVVGHYDTVARTSGSADNTGGTASLINVAEYFAKKTPERTIKIIFFSGEEMGLLGSYSYVDKYKEEIKKYAGLVVNIDVSGDDIGANSFFVIGTHDLKGYVNGVSMEKGIMFNTKLDIYSSDCIPFSVYEIPSVNIARFGGKATFNIHTPDDSVKHVTKRGLLTTSEAAINLLERVANAKIFPIRREIDTTLRDRIEKYLWNSTMEKPKLEWTPKYKK